MKYRHQIILLTLVALFLGCAPTSSAGTEVGPRPSSTPTQVRITAATPTSPLLLTVTASHTFATIPTTLPAATPYLTAVVSPVSQIVIGVSVGKTVTFTSCKSANAVVFTGTITTNSSATVEYDWLLRGVTTFSSPPQKTNFPSAKRHNVFSSVPYYAACGKYSLSLHVIYPNYMIATINFFIP